MSDKTLIALIVWTGLAGGCASLAEDRYQLFSVQARQKNLQDVTGASCELITGNDRWFLTTPGTLTIPRSGDELQVTCRRSGLETGRATVVPSIKSAQSATQLAKPADGVPNSVGHGNRSAYEYPDLIQIVMGTHTRIEGSGDAETYTLQSSATAATPASVLPSAAAASVALPSPAPSAAPPPPVASAAPVDTDAATAAPPAADPNPPYKPVDTDLQSFNFKMVRRDACDAYVSESDYCWWSPPTKRGACPIITSLKKCKASYGAGCRLGHGPDLPKC